MTSRNDYSGWSKEDLIKKVKALEKRKKYGLVWDAAREPEKVVLDCQKELPVLKEIKENEISSDKDDITNILIEGDNYHSLSVLNYTHEKAVDLIYIDPPYNTGNGDFTYNDRYIDREDPYRHTKWLSFMSNRLRLAKNLLKDTGVIFISIDDNEQGHLKLLCDEVFNENNFLAIITWQSTDTLRNDAKYFSANSEFILCYAKHKEQARIKGILKGEKQKGYYKNDDSDGRGPYLLTPLHAKSGSESGIYEYKFKNGQIWKPPKGTYPRFSKETLASFENEGRLWLDPKGGKVPQRKTYLSEVSDRMPLWTFWRYEDFGSTRQSNQELSAILGRGIFQNPKPTKLIKIIADSVTEKDSTVLDFFAGSGTTAQAVMELNRDDGGNRQSILCTNNENNICTDVCYPRIRNAMNGYTTAKGENIEALGGNLKYYITSFVPAEPTDKNKELLTRQSIEMLTLKEGTFEKVTTNPSYVIYRNVDRYTGIIFDQLSFDEFKKAVAKIDKPISLYIFSLADEDFGDDFADMKGLIKICAIPEAILRVYRRIFR